MYILQCYAADYMLYIYIYYLLIVEHMHGQFLIEVKLLDTFPASVWILGTNNVTFNN